MWARHHTYLNGSFTRRNQRLDSFLDKSTITDESHTRLGWLSERSRSGRLYFYLDSTMYAGDILSGVSTINAYCHSHLNGT